ncbi:hypothetical protein PT974_11562 [Cladobotryum mycophilum]|uniref:C2H2-type domain-containing protein n=1 Tax=Cladobotryum mycophilum TaxID=491253 RepID=A0ABR0S6L4_9HYPO
MGSLRNIMNVDDDHIDSHSIRRDRRSGSRSTMDQDPSMSMPRYSGPVDYSTSQYSSRRNSPPQPSEEQYQHRFDGVCLQSQPGPRKLILSGTYQTNHARRSHREAPVKLTPITGRVSRAKKGVPVHTCEVCRPAKTFTRAEHLRRHQLSHQPPELACTVPGCEKVFHRKDLLERHQQRHEQDDKMNKDVGQSSRRSYTTSSPSRGYGNSPPMQSLQMPSFGGPNVGGVRSIPEVSMSSGHWSVSRSSHGGNPLSSPHMREAQNAYHLGEIKSEYVVDSVAGIHGSSTRLVPGYDEPRSAADMGVLSTVPDLCMSDPVSSNLPWADGAGLASSASGSTYSTPPSDQHPRVEPQVPSGLDRCRPSIPLPALSSPLEDIPSLSGMPRLLHKFTPQSTAMLWVCPCQAMKIALPSMVIIFLTTHREPVDALGLFMTQDMTSVNLNREARSAIPAYLEVYWDKVHSMYPIIHKPTFENASDMIPEHLDILQCAMAAVATQFLEHQDHRNNGHQLHTYAWDKSKMYTNAPEWPLPIMQSVLLCEYYARFRGRNKKAYEPSLRFETLYQMVINMQNTFAPNLAGCNDSQRWKIWVDMESRRRLLSACFLLDVHGMSYLEQPRVRTLGLDYTAPETLPIPLSISTAQLWDAQTFQEWSNMNHSGVISTVGGTLLGELSAADISAIPAFDAALFQATHALQLPQRQSLTKVDLLEDASGMNINQFNLVNLFPYSHSAMTYLALHHTPLHTLLSVSGDSWVFNKKVLQARDFMEHQNQLRKWRESGSAAVAATFAARALSLFLGLQMSTGEDGNVLMTVNLPGPQYKEISDFWGVYVCALICWAFGHVGACRTDVSRPSRSAAVQWIVNVADMQPGQLQNMSDEERQDASGAIGLARASLERDCLGGRNMLLADALGVLKKLEEGDNYRRF